MAKTFGTIDIRFQKWMRSHGITILRYALGAVFLWFGLLKVIGQSPVTELIASTYSFLPTHTFIVILGIWEIVIGVGLILNLCIRTTLFLLWLQMAGTFFALFLRPSIFFNGNLLYLTTDGEFVIKNLILVSAGIVIGGSSVKK